MTLHVLDGGGFVYRAYHATAGGGPVAGLQAFAGMLDKLERDHRPERAVVAFDSRGRTWRHELYPEYKATRSPPPAELIAQLPRFRPLATALGWPTVAQPGLEADDLVAALVGAELRAGGRVVIHAADKDLLQLVSADVEIEDAVRKLRWTEQLVEAKHQVAPARFGDYLAIRGDDQDNVPGVDGAGDKTAAELVRRFPSIDATIAANPKIRGKYPLAPGAPGVELLRLSRKLVALRGDDTGLTDGAVLTLGRRDQAAVRELCTPPRPPEQLALGAPAAPGGKPPWSHEPDGRPVWSRPGLEHLELDYQERAAILEYSGGYVRAEAEYRAYTEIAGGAR